MAYSLHLNAGTKTTNYTEAELSDLFQVQQPVQFAFQPQSYSSAPTQSQYTSQIQHLGTSQLETIANEAARHHGVG